LLEISKRAVFLQAPACQNIFAVETLRYYTRALDLAGIEKAPGKVPSLCDPTKI
jgi:hypothetical protein